MKNKDKVSHTGFWRAQYKADEQLVLFLTDMTEEELTDMKLDMGREWIVKQLADQNFSREYCERVWGMDKVIRWWLLNWKTYDHYTVIPVVSRLLPEQRCDTYNDMHLNTFRELHPRNIELREQLAGILDVITKTPKEVRHAETT